MESTVLADNDNTSGDHATNMTNPSNCLSDYMTPSTVELSNIYHRQLAHLLKLFNISEHYTVIPCTNDYQDCFNVLPSHGAPVSHVTYVHRHSLVLADRSVEYRKDTPLLFYTHPTPIPSVVSLSMSARSEAHLLKYDYGLQFKSEYIQSHIENRKSELYLSNEIFSVMFNTQHWAYSFINDWDSGQSNRGTSDGGEIPHHGTNTSSLIKEERMVHHETFTGLRMFDWPEEADFICRHHRLSTHWPPQSLITECHKLGCVLIPYQPCEKQNTSHSSYWTYSFDECRILFRHALDADARRAMFVFIWLMKNDHLTIPELLLETALFWSLENITSENSPLKIIEFTLTTLLKSAERENLPDYFVPTNNLLSRISQENIGRLRGHLQIVLHNLDKLFDQCTTGIANTEDVHILDQQRYKQQFEDNLSLQLFIVYKRSQQLPDEVAIDKQKQIIRLLNEEDGNLILKENFVRFQESILATLYQNLLKREKSKQRKEYLYKRVEALLINNEFDVSLSKLWLALFYYQQAKFTECSGILQSFTSTDVPEIQQPSENVPNSEFGRELWRKWDQKKMYFNFMSSVKVSFYCFNSFVTKSFMLASSQKFGLQHNITFLVQFNFIGRFLHLMSDVKINTKSTIMKHQADMLSEIVNGMDCIDDNELRAICCTNLLAECYTVIGQSHTATVHMRKSFELFPSIRNPARLTLFASNWHRLVATVRTTIVKYMLRSLFALGFGVVGAIMMG